MTLIEINQEDIERINIPFRLHRINREKHKFILKTRLIFVSNPNTQFSTKEIHKKVYTGGGKHCYKTISRVLTYLEKEGFITSKKVRLLTGGFKRIWWKVK